MNEPTQQNSGPAELPLSTLNRRLKTIVETETRGKPVQVWGVAVGVIRSRNGYVHCRLRQGNFGLSCYVPREVVQPLSFWIEDGQTLRVLGEIEVYAPWGRLQIVAQQVELESPATEDEALEALKRRAKTAGWLEPTRKRTLPQPPRAIGLVVGERSQARADVMGSLEDVGINALLVLQTAQMQGPEATPTIVSALAALNAHPDVEVIVIARGGGSKAELSVFNDWDLAQAVVASRVPVLTAIGHREDRTLADLVADLTVPTPSMVGAALMSEASMDDAALPEDVAVEPERPTQRHAIIGVAAFGVLIVLALLLMRALGWF